MENITVMQLADAIRQAAGEVEWQPGGGPHGDDYWRQIALRTRGNLRRCGATGQLSEDDAHRLRAALTRIRQH